MKRIEAFVIDCMNKQIAFGLKTDICFCIGEGENLKYLQKLNSTYKWIDKIKSLSHPRFIMQYRVKRKEEFIQRYLTELRF
jgi:hypothetical protein